MRLLEKRYCKYVEEMAKKQELKKQTDQIHRVELKKKIRGDIKRYYQSRRTQRILLRPISEDINEENKEDSSIDSNHDRLSTLHECEEFNQLPSNQSELDLQHDLNEQIRDVTSQEQQQQNLNINLSSSSSSSDGDKIVFPKELVVPRKSEKKKEIERNN